MYTRISGTKPPTMSTPHAFGGYRESPVWLHTKASEGLIYPYMWLMQSSTTTKQDLNTLHMPTRKQRAIKTGHTYSLEERLSNRELMHSLQLYATPTLI